MLRKSGQGDRKETRGTCVLDAWRGVLGKRRTTSLTIGFDDTQVVENVLGEWGPHGEDGGENSHFVDRGGSKYNQGFVEVLMWKGDGKWSYLEWAAWVKGRV